jgi:glycine/D-amino acid oxidase-like deaminating enzyme
MRTVVVGAGVMGTWTALWLRRRGQEVTLLDQHGVASRLASSGDTTRVTRSGHGTDRHYPAWQRRSLEQWRDLQAVSGQTLFVPCGVLWFAHAETGFEADSLASLDALGIPVERWSTDDLRRRLPVCRPDGLAWAMFEPEAGALLARGAVLAAAAAFEAAGGVIERGVALAPDPDARRLDEVQLAGGRRLAADAVVFACGPWLPSLFPSVIGRLIRATRQGVVHFAAPPGDPRYVADRMPIWVDYEEAFYGFPDVAGHGLKCCPDWLGPEVDPDRADRTVDEATITAARGFMRRRFPAVADQPLADLWACLYEVTPDTHLVVDRHPAWANAWLVGGGSGHGFKHGPAIGEYVAARVSGDAEAERRLEPPDDRFAIRERSADVSLRTSGRRPDAPALP